MTTPPATSHRSRTEDADAPKRIMIRVGIVLGAVTIAVSVAMLPASLDAWHAWRSGAAERYAGEHRGKALFPLVVIANGAGFLLLMWCLSRMPARATWTAWQRRRVTLAAGVAMSLVAASFVTNGVLVASLSGDEAAAAAPAPPDDRGVYLALLADWCGDADPCTAVDVTPQRPVTPHALHIAESVAGLDLAFDAEWVVQEHRRVSLAPGIIAAFEPYDAATPGIPTGLLRYRRGTVARDTLPPRDAARLWFSPVMYDRAGTGALVFRHFWCGEMCAHEDYFALRRADGGAWRVVKRIPIGAS